MDTMRSAEQYHEDRVTATEQAGGITLSVEDVRQAAYIAHQFVCVTPLFEVMTQPHRSEESKQAAEKICGDIEMARSLNARLRAALAEAEQLH